MCKSETYRDRTTKVTSPTLFARFLMEMRFPSYGYTRETTAMVAEMKSRIAARVPRAGVGSFGYKQVVCPLALTNFTAKSPVGCRNPTFRILRQITRTECSIHLRSMQCQFKAPLWMLVISLCHPKTELEEIKEPHLAVLSNNSKNKSDHPWKCDHQSKRPSLS